MADGTTRQQQRIFSKQDYIHVVHINARSLLCNFEEIKLLVQENKIDILCVSETWIRPGLDNRFLNIPGYVVIRQDSGIGGGACIYINQDLTVKKIETSILKMSQVEDLWVTVQCRKLPSVIIGSIYRHPHAQAASFDYISDVIKEILLKSKPTFIFGDLNDDLLMPNAKLSHIIRDTKMHQVVDRPTRITENSSTLLDILITNNPDMLTKLDVVPCQIADHEIIMVDINLKKPKHKPQIKTFRSLANYSPDALCERILHETQTLNHILNTDDVNVQTKILTEVLTTATNDIAPVKTSLIRRPPAPWINSDLKKSLSERDKIHRLLKLDRNNHRLQEAYKTKKKQVKASIHLARSTYFKDQLKVCGTDSKKKWKVLKKLIPDKKSDSNSYNYDNVPEKAEHFNEFFSNVGKVTFERTQENVERNLNNNIRPSAEIPNIEKFRPQPVTVDTVILTFKQINESNAVGSDDIGFKFLKDSFVVIAFYITIIINTSIVTGIYPDLWKHALVLPFFKTGDPNDVTNFRPISILPVLSKLLEKVIANQLSEFLENNSLISNTQHGFRKHLSTETALMKVTDKVYNNIDNNRITLLILCDLSKAFDSINRDILHKKLAACRIDSFWFESYLSHRSQSVKIGKTISSKKSVDYGVPQGSILGPLLFTIFVNDMSTLAVDCELVQYADDSQFIFTGSPANIRAIIEKAERTLKNVKHYFNINGLKVNPDKTQAMFLGSRQYLAKIPNGVKNKF